MFAPKLTVYSLGRVAVMLSVNASLVLRVAEQLGIAPEWEVDGVPHFRAGDVTRIRAKVTGGETLNDPDSP